MTFLPQISRKFSAINWSRWGSPVRWILLTLSIVASLMGKSELARKRELSIVPAKREAHVQLAQAYFRLGEEDKAKSELQGEVLGSQSEAAELSHWRDELAKNKLKLITWQQITEKYPTYRDGYLLTGYYAMLTKEWQSAKAAFEAAAVIDPDDTRVRELQKYLE